jgi:hypothetical protein
MPMKMIALVGALCFLIASSTFCRADSGPWCAPDVVTLTFKDQQGQQDRDLARIELRTLKPVCDRNPAKFQGVGLERSMRIERNGQWTEVPSVCVSGVSFGVEGLSLSGGKTGVGIRLTGKSTDRGESAEIMIYTVRDEVFCSLVEPCPSHENQNHEIQECYRRLN